MLVSLPALAAATSPLAYAFGNVAEGAGNFGQDIGQFFSDVWHFAAANFWTLVIWGFVISWIGGWALLGAILKRVWYALPFNRRKALAYAERQRLERDRILALDEAHAANCPCGERCDGRQECEEHHPDCNCDHMGSYCVCQDEEECDCECRCDCKECDGFYKEEPLRRIPHGSGAIAREPKPASTAAPARPVGRTDHTARTSRPSWAQAREQFLALSVDYTNYESDVHELLRLPALADVTFEPTATFVETFMTAHQLLTDTEPTDPVEARQFVEAAAKAENAWKVAVQAAEVIGDKRLDDEERTLLRRANRSLQLAENTSEVQERVRAHERAGALVNRLANKTEKSGRWRLPARARQQIEAWARPELTAGEGATTPERRE